MNELIKTPSEFWQKYKSLEKMHEYIKILKNNIIVGSLGLNKGLEIITIYENYMNKASKFKKDNK